MCGIASGTELKTEYQRAAPPRYFLDSGKPTGICVEIIDTLNTRLKGKNIKIVSVNNEMPFARIMKDLKDAKIDIFLCAAKNKERLKYLDYDPSLLLDVYYTLVKHKTDTFEYLGQESLNGKRISALRGTTSARGISKVPGVKTNLTNTMFAALKMLTLRRVDLVYYHNLGLSWNVGQSPEFKDLMVMKARIKSSPQYLVFSKTANVSESVKSTIRNEIALMVNEGIIDEIISKY
jgi:ABC-type amino acid transport substrate-binding protein